MRRHQLNRVAAIAAVLAVGVTDSAADETTFDFVAPRADQSGSYAPTGDAIVSGGFGTLAPVAGWFSESWRYRLSVAVDNPDPAALLEWPLALDADSASTGGYQLFNLAQADAGDLRIVDGASAIMPVSRGFWDLAGSRGRLWFRRPSLATGTTNLLLYFGNYGSTTADDPASIFTYSAPYASRYALDPGAVTMTVASSTAANDYQTGAVTGTLAAAGDTVDVATADWSQGQAIASDGPVEVAFDVNTGTEGAPVAFARTRHALVMNRGAGNNFHLLAPLADTTVTITEGGSSIGTAALTAGVATTFSHNVGTDAVVELSAASPFLVAHEADDDVDGVVFPPPATDVWGFRSGTPRVLAVSADATITVWDSSGAVSTQTIAAGSFAALASGGSGNAAAVRILSDQLITVIATADGDGGDSIVFHPSSELGRQWVVPTTGHFVQIAVSRGGTSCTLTAPGGATTTVAAAGPFPAHAVFGTDGSSSVAAGSVVSCEAPGMAIYEDAGTDDERNLYPMESHRKVGVAAPTVTLGDTVDTRYDATPSTIETPDAIAPTAVVAWTDFRVAADEPDHTSIRFQLSVDSGATWLVPDSGAWVAPADDTTGVTATAIRDDLATLPTHTGRVRARVILHSEDGVALPAVDAVKVFYDAAGSASRLRWEPLPGTIVTGESVDATLRAVDGDGVVITGLDGEVTLSSSHAGMVLPPTVQLTAGVARFSLKLTGAADDISVRAEGPGGLIGFSTTFDLITPEGAVLEKVSGDDQFGPVGTVLGEPFTVRVVDAAGSPIGGVQVTYAVLEGGGAMEPGGASAAAITDGSGVATGFLRLGDSAGANRVRVESAGSTVEFNARADRPGSGDGDDDGGGCCRVGAGESPAGALLLAAGVGTMLLRRRRRALARRLLRW